MRTTALCYVMLCAVIISATIVEATNTTAAPGGLPNTPMSWEAWLVVASLLAMTAAMIAGFLSSTAAMILTTVFLSLCGVISHTQVFAGLVNNGVLAIALMYVIVHPVAELPIARAFFSRVIRPWSPGSLYWSQFKLCVISAIVSIFIENVPQVALMAPIVLRVCSEFDISAAQLLMPMAHIIALSNGSHIASSSNLIIAGLLESITGKRISFFEVIKSNGPAVAVVIIYAMLAPQFLLSNEKVTMDHIKSRSAKFVAMLRLPAVNCTICGKSIAQIFQMLPTAVASGVKITELIRQKTTFYNPEESIILQALDQLVVSGSVEDMRSVRRILSLDWVAAGDGFDTSLMSGEEREEEDEKGEEVVGMKEIRGNVMSIPMDDEASPTALLGGGGGNPSPMIAISPQIITDSTGKEAIYFSEVTLSSENPAVGSTVRSMKFQRTFQCTIISICFAGTQENACGQSMLSHVLHEGDTILVRSSKAFVQENQSDLKNFYYFASHGEHFHDDLESKYVAVPSWFPFAIEMTSVSGTFVRLPEWWPNMTLVVFCGVVAVAIVGVELSFCAIVGACAMVLLHIVTVKEAIHHIEWSVYLTSAFSFGLGAAMTQSKLALVIGEKIIAAEITGFPLVLLLATLTSILSNVITNRGAVQVLLPISVAIFKAVGADPIIAGVIVSNSAACALITPYGGTVGLIVQPAGKYVALDFVKFGGPLTVLYLIVQSLFVCIVYNFW